jgi:glucosamine-phosphate N-acetyltransferase
MNGTTHSSTDSLFPESLISPAVAAALPEGYTIRPLQRGDYAAGFLDVLRVLTIVGEISQADFEARFDDMKQTSRGPVGSHVLVILDGEGKVVGTGALLVERKLYVLCALAICVNYNLRSFRVHGRRRTTC